MSDVAAIQELVQRQKALKQEIAKVIVGQDEQSLRAFGSLGQLFRLGQGRGQRLVADDMDALFQKGA